MLGDLKTRKSTGTSCQIEIHFLSNLSNFSLNTNFTNIIFFTKHDYKVSTSFIKEIKDSSD